MPSHFENRFKFIPVDNYSGIAILSNFPEACPYSHSDLDLIQIDIDNLSRDSRSFIQLYLRHHIRDLSLEVFWCLTHNGKSVNLAKSFELMRLQDSLSSASWTDWSWWKEVCVTSLAMIAFNVVYRPNSSPDLRYSMCCHLLSTSLGCGQSTLPRFLQY
jgi:hypothetical protein